MLGVQKGVLGYRWERIGLSGRGRDDCLGSPCHCYDVCGARPSFISSPTNAVAKLNAWETNVYICHVLVFACGNLVSSVGRFIAVLDRDSACWSNHLR